MKLNIRKKFVETISNGRWQQIVWLLVAIFIAYGILFILNVIGKGDLSWQELLSVYLDPGNFKDDAVEEMTPGIAFFRLVISLTGVLLMSALLISVISNTFENISDSYKKGDIKFKSKSHILILGAGYQLNGMLEKLKNKKCSEIIIVSEKDIETLRNTIRWSLEKENPKFFKKLSFHHGKIDDTYTLQKAHADKASSIYIIGDDITADHDRSKIRCCDKLKAITKKSQHEIRCYLLLNDRVSVDVFKYLNSAEEKEQKLKIDTIAGHNQMARSVLASEHDLYPKIDYIKCNGFVSGKSIQEIGIKEDTDKYVHFVISGMSEVGKAMALTAANICHFPNFKDSEYRTRITFITKDIEHEMPVLTSRYENLFCLSHYRMITFNNDGEQVIKSFTPDEKYGDFLDIEWEFIEGNVTDQSIRNLLIEWNKDEKQSLSICLAEDCQDTNLTDALSLPDEIYMAWSPIFVYQEEGSEIIKKARESQQYGLVYSFGMNTNTQDDPLFENMRSKRTNHVYNYGSTNDMCDPQKEWDKLTAANRFSNNYFADSIYCKLHSMGIYNIAEDITIPTDETLLHKMEIVEHRRWMIASLLLGHYAMEKKEREELSKLRDADTEDIHTGEDKFKERKGNFFHHDIMPYEELPKVELAKNSDRNIIINIPYILGKTNKIIK